MNKFKNRISKLFFDTKIDKILALSIFVTLLTTLGVSYYMIIEKQYSREKQENDKHEERILRYICKNLELQLSKSSLEKAGETLSPVLEYENIAQIKIIDIKNNKTLFYKIFPNRLKGDIYKKSCSIYKDKKIIGKTVITFSRNRLKEKFNNYLYQNISLFIFQFFLILILLYGVYYLKIFLPIKRLQNMMKSIKNNNFENEQRWEYKDEINEIGKSLQETTKIINTLINTDNITKLYNRSKLENILFSHMEEAKKRKSPLSIILFKIENLQYINNFQGYFEGDIILKKLSSFLLKYKRIDDTVGRWSAKEFLIILPSTTHQEAVHIAYNLQESLKIGILDISIESSFGLGTYIAEEDMKTFLQRAYKSLFLSKNSPIIKESLD